VNEALDKFYAATTKQVEATSGIKYRIKAQSSADYVSALGFVPSLRASIGESKGDQSIAEFVAMQHEVCRRCTTEIEYGGVVSAPGDPADWPQVDVAFVFSAIQEIVQLRPADAETERRVL